MKVLAEERKALAILIVFHILVIASSNYLVQFPFTVSLGSYSVDTTPGSFTFPLIFLATDLTVRIFGASLARTIIAYTMIPALIVSYLISILFSEGQFQGFHLYFNMDIFRIALASFAAYTSGQLSDIVVFNRIRRNRAWWIAPSAATIGGSAVDTLIFFWIAFYKSDNDFMAENWFNLGVADYLTKLFICAILLLPLYGIILNKLLNLIRSGKYNP